MAVFLITFHILLLVLFFFNLFIGERSPDAQTPGEG